MNTQNKLNVVLFCGGRGAGTIIEVLSKHPQIQLTLLVNTYDDGLSTGMLRRFIPGMLGPSDVRKNCSRLIAKNEKAFSSLHELVEFRFPKDISNEKAEKDLLNLERGEIPELKFLREHYLNLSVESAGELGDLLKSFLEYKKSSRGVLNYADCSLGNLAFAGAYLKDRDFNRAVERFSKLCRIDTEVLNITDGSNRVLVGLKEDGRILEDEAALVGEQGNSRVKEIFLLENYLSTETLSQIKKLSIEEKAVALRTLEKRVEINPRAEQALKDAKLIIYGPGTQHSSLFPSYLTEKISESIASNTVAEKVFVANIRKDFEIQGETVESLTQKLVYYVNRKGRTAFKLNDLITKSFFQKIEGDSDQVYITASSDLLKDEKNVGINWESNPGVHLGGKVVDELLSIANQKVQTNLKAMPYMVSIIVPALNEEKTVRRVLHDLVLLNFQTLGLAKEIIFVDGGSTDLTLLYAKNESNIRVFELPRGSGRGDVLRYGIEQALGNIIVFFHADGEYSVSDLPKVVMAIVQNEFKVVFGSRAIKCIDLNDRIKEIYRDNYFGFIVGKYGGMILSLISQVLYNRFVSDPLTGIKAFEGRLLTSLALKSSGMNLETEIIAKLAKKKVFILELPVEYAPRTKKAGKKSTFWDGIQSLWTLVSTRWSHS